MAALNFMLAICMSMIATFTKATLIVPKDNPKVYKQYGDLNIGFLMNIQGPRSGDRLCGGPVSLTEIQQTEVVVKTVADINARDDILPNITLGLIILDTCRSPTIALARSTYFTPDAVACKMTSNSTDTCPGDILNDPEAEILIVNQPHYDVVGVIGPGWSSQAVPVSSLLSVFQIPCVSQSASSAELSDKSRYKYFSRVYPADQLRIVGMIDLILHFEWTYVIVLYSEGSYGETLSKHLEKGLKGTGVCFAFSHRIPSDADEEEYNWIVDELVKETKAKVIVSLMEYKHSVPMTEQIKKRKVDKKYIYVSGGWFYSTTTEHYDTREGSILFNTLPVDIPGFNEFFLKRQPWKEPVQPWLLQLWEELLHCSWEVSKQDNTSCYNFGSLEKMPNGYVKLAKSSAAGRYADAALVFGNALHHLITDQCPHVFTNPSLARNCVKGQTLLDYIRSTNINGTSGLISFDENGDLKGKFQIQQVHKDRTGGYKLVNVGTWDSLSTSNKLKLDMNKFDFSVMKTTVESGMMMEEHELKSVCSESCPPRHSIIRGNIPCCWECNECRPNEILSRNGSKCESCDLNMWPDDVTGNDCAAIQPSYLQWTSPLSISLLTTAILSLAINAVVAIVFCLHRKHKLVLATSRGLSNLILCGTTLVCLDVFLVVSQPTKTVCLIRRAAFHLGVTLVYGPLLIKTIRIYRVFHASLKGQQKVKFVSANQQLVLAVIVICTEVNCESLCFQCVHSNVLANLGMNE